MPVLSFDHVNIRTADVPAAAAFYAELLGLEATDAPGGLPRETAQWLRDPQGRAILHLYAGPTTPGPTGPVHHLAFDCSGRDAIVARLEARQAAFDRFEASPGHTMIFTRDPHGILLELNFRNEPAAAIAPNDGESEA